MALFQQSVLKKYLSELDKDAVQKNWTAFTAHFHNPTIQQNILNAKEEEYQEGFVRDLFVNVLGYTLYPQPDYNFVLEKKTETDSTKSDGAILHGDIVSAIIELKDTSTTDLDKVEKQAFGYKHRHRDCNYVIISNFQKLRFYINDATEHEEFDMFTLTKERFEVLWLCLQQQYFFKGIALQIKQASVTEEEQVTKKLYSDYSSFRKKLFHNIAKLNPQHDKVDLFKRTQKLLDRFLFILFAEDRWLVPANSVRMILDDWKKLKDLDAAQPLYQRFKLYFSFLNTGRDKTDNKEEIFAYNGGLFATDELLDSLQIDDDILFESSVALSNYDFQTEVDVNILGHIFEHSLTEIEELQAEAEGKTIDKTKTKRKKDGVFYTPRYITKYIVENTIGALCKQKKEELQLNEEDYAPLLKKKNQKQLLEKLTAYRHWLLQLTICDPACGSGAFLNQALEYLIAEHRHIDELDAKLGNHSIIYSDVEKSILENNLYGVDINEEAVEIARLSLWLRTAQKGRKLSSLSENIKCGNSLIDDETIAGDKAFNWQNEFSGVFKNGGFDVVIGNPPYVDVKNLPNNIIKYLFNEYSTTENRINLYSIFIEKAIQLLSNSGYLSFINPNSMLVNSSYKKLRELLIKPLKQIIKLPDDVFSEAKVETMIFVLQKNKTNSSVDVLYYSKDDKITSIDLNKFITIQKEEWHKHESLNFNLYLSSSSSKIFSKVEKDSVPLIDCSDFSLGITPYDKYKGHSEKDIENRVFHSTSKISDEYKPLITGENIVRYYTLPHVEEYIKYGSWLGRPREERFFNQERIIARQIVSGNPPRIYASYANEPYYFTHHGFGMIPHDNVAVKYLLPVLNSRLINYYHAYKFLDIEKRLFQKFLIENCKKLPIKIISKEQQLPFIAKADTMLSKNKELHELKQKFLQLLESNFTTVNINKKLEQWPTLSFAIFLKELSKLKIKLTLPQQEEWIPYFEEQKNKATALQNTINSTDAAIDQMVYQLYELTAEEIAIVEGS